MKDTKISPTTNGTDKRGEEKNTQAKANGAGYVSPQIVTHSAEKLQKSSYAVNACASFVP